MTSHERSLFLSFWLGQFVGAIVLIDQVERVNPALIELVEAYKKAKAELEGK